MFHVPEEYRLRTGAMGSDGSYGNNGYFIIPHKGLILWTIASDGIGWEHVSVSLRYKPKTRKGIVKYDRVRRCPFWDEMCFVKELFWDDEDVVVQFHPVHPAKSEYINNYDFCLHLWKPIEQKIFVPEKILV